MISKIETHKKDNAFTVSLLQVDGALQDNPVTRSIMFSAA